MRKTILAVASDDSELALIERAFCEAGLSQELQVVRSTAETIRFLSGEPPYDDRDRHPFPALLLLGLGIGPHAGADVLRWLKQNGKLNERLPVVVWSPLESAEQMEAAYAWGANSYVVRPADFGRLTILVRNLAEYWLTTNRLPQFS